MRSFILFLATGAGSGYFPWMPGTVGSLAGILLYYSLRSMPRGPYLAFVVAFFFLAVWVAGLAEVIFGAKDPQRIVIDEIVGMLVTLVLLPLSWKTALVGFVLFRVFDIWKPFPIRLVQDNIPGGWGVVGDDVVAAIYANLILQILVRITPPL